MLVGHPSPGPAEAPAAPSFLGLWPRCRPLSLIRMPALGRGSTQSTSRPSLGSLLPSQVTLTSAAWRDLWGLPVSSLQCLLEGNVGFFFCKHTGFRCVASVCSPGTQPIKRALRDLQGPLWVLRVPGAPSRSLSRGHALFAVSSRHAQGPLPQEVGCLG